MSSILDNFEVIEVPRNSSIAEVRVLKNGISFNLSAASELGYPAYVRVFISKDKTQLALQPCDKIAPNAMRFFNVEDATKKKKKTIPVGNRALAALIKSGMGWSMDKPMRAPGIRFSDENCIIFDLNQACVAGTQPTETSLAVVPQPAIPFLPVSTEYFSNDQQGRQKIIDIEEGEVQSA